MRSKEFTTIRKQLFLLSVLLLIGTVSGFGQKWIGLTKIGTGGYYDLASIHSSKTDLYGNTYILGAYDTKIILGEKEYQGPNYRKNNFFIAKLDPTGKVLWSNTFSGKSTDNIYELNIYIDKVGNVVILGNFSNYMIFSDQIKLTIPSTGVWSTKSYFVCRYSKEGVPLWAKYISHIFEMNDAGEFYSFGVLHNGFDNYVGWEAFNNAGLEYLDTLRHYNIDGELIAKYVHSYPNIGSSNYSGLYSSKLLYRNNQLWLLENGSKFSINKLSIETGEFVEISSFEVNSYDAGGMAYDLKNGRLYLLGNFYYSGSINFGGIEVVAKKPNSVGKYEKEGFLYQYNIETNSFEWGSLIDNTSSGFNKYIKTSNSGVIYLATEIINVGTPNFVQAFDSNGNFLWQLQSSAYIMDYVNIELDQYDNLYVTGNTFNGSNTKAIFGDYFYSYDYTVGFLARIQNSNCTPIQNSVVANICYGDKYKIGSDYYESSGIYTSNLFSSTGCDSTVTVNLTVKKIEAKIESESATLKATPDNAIYQWIECDGIVIEDETSQYYSPVKSGLYSALITIDGCTSESECFDFVILDNEESLNNNVSITQTENQFILTPTNRQMPIELLSIYNGNGQLITNFQKEDDNSFIVEKKNLSAGLYIFRLSGRNYLQTIKIVIQ